MLTSAIPNALGAIAGSIIEHVPSPANGMEMGHVKIERSDGKNLILWQFPTPLAEVFTDNNHYLHSAFDQYGNLTSIETYRCDSLDELMNYARAWATMERPDWATRTLEIARIVGGVRGVHWTHVQKNPYNITDYILVDTKVSTGPLMKLVPDQKNLDQVLYSIYKNRTAREHCEEPET